jgi:hypothetical protein
VAAASAVCTVDDDDDGAVSVVTFAFIIDQMYLCMYIHSLAESKGMIDGSNECY